jgi:hypothetical protein
MSDLAGSVGNVIGGLVSGAFQAMGDALRGIVDAGQRALPGGLLWVVVVAALIGLAWFLAKR